MKHSTLLRNIKPPIFIIVYIVKRHLLLGFIRKNGNINENRKKLLKLDGSQVLSRYIALGSIFDVYLMANSLFILLINHVYFYFLPIHPSIPMVAI